MRSSTSGRGFSRVGDWLLRLVGGQDGVQFRKAVRVECPRCGGAAWLTDEDVQPCDCRAV